MTNDLTATAIGDLTFQGNNYEIYGTTMTLGQSDRETTIHFIGTSNLLRVDTVLGGPVTVALATAQLAVIPANINLGRHNLSFRIQSDLVCSGVISGTGGVTKAQRSRLIFSGESPNTYSGITTVSEGTLVLSKFCPGPRGPGLATPQYPGTCMWALTRIPLPVWCYTMRPTRSPITRASPSFARAR